MALRARQLLEGMALVPESSEEPASFISEHLLHLDSVWGFMERFRS